MDYILLMTCEPTKLCPVNTILDYMYCFLSHSVLFVLVMKWESSIVRGAISLEAQPFIIC